MTTDRSSTALAEQEAFVSPTIDFLLVFAFFVFLGLSSTVFFIP